MPMDKRSYYWIKLHTAYLANSKFLMLTVPTRYYYIALYLLACEGDSGGVLVQNGEVLSVKEIAFLLHEDEKVLQESINELVQSGLLLVENDGAYTIKRFMEDQGKASFGADDDKKKQVWRERQARHRNKLCNSTDGDADRKVYSDSNGEVDVVEEVELDSEKDEDLEGHVSVTDDTYVTSSGFLDSSNAFESIYDPNKEYKPEEVEFIEQRLSKTISYVIHVTDRARVFDDFQSSLNSYFPDITQAMEMPYLETTVDYSLNWMKSNGFGFFEVIKEELEKGLHINPDTQGWHDFISYASERMENHKEPFETFVSWFNRKGYDIVYVSPEKMMTIYPKAFIPETTN